MGGSCDERSPPLRIVLGAFNGASQSSKNEAMTATGGEKMTPQSSSPATYILGTSYFATPRLGNSSVGSSSSSNRRSVLKLNKDGRVPMEDRKGSFDHFKPKSLALSVSLLYFLSSSENCASSRKYHASFFSIVSCSEN